MIQVTLTKKSGSEEVMITLNVNHTVDSAAPDDGTGEVRFVTVLEICLIVCTFYHLLTVYVLYGHNL